MRAASVPGRPLLAARVLALSACKSEPVSSAYDADPPVQGASSPPPPVCHRQGVRTRRDGDEISASVRRAGQWEAGLVHEILARLRAAAAAADAAGQRPPVLLDIGANLGAFALAVASAGHRVIAIEALAANAVALRRSLCRNPALGDRVLLFDKALGASAELNCVIVSGIDNKVRSAPPELRRAPAPSRAPQPRRRVCSS